MNYCEFFKTATGNSSYRYQCRLACGDDARVEKPETLTRGRDCTSLLINVPTGLGKTAAVVLAWLWNRVGVPPLKPQPSTNNSAQWPRRLVYCLPMRTLVEQTRENVTEWLKRLAEEFPESAEMKWLAERSPVILMGGEEIDARKADWDIYPEKPAILIGTQDMLLSRALNRGYGMSRYRWPMHFGLLNSDCLWVMDEVQLMGPGLGTACQLEALRLGQSGAKRFFGSEPENRSVTWYVSATASRKLLASRDWRNDGGDCRPPDSEFVLRLSAEEKNDRSGPLGKRRRATKRLLVDCEWKLEDSDTVSRILQEHRNMVAALQNHEGLPRRSLIICNTVAKACALLDSLRAARKDGPYPSEVVLLHSRFRRPDRDAALMRLKGGSVGPAGQIVISTQVIEAGVDISSAILWSEVAPLASVVQRLGRLNRAGEFGFDGAVVSAWTPAAYMLGLGNVRKPARESEQAAKKRVADNTKRSAPYDWMECESSIDTLAPVQDASPASLETALVGPLAAALKPPVGALQRHELLDLFDTDSNLSLAYTDASPFVRGSDRETDVYVLWRTWDDSLPPFGGDIGANELCPVPIGGIQHFGNRWRGFVWLGRERGWQRVNNRNLYPGATLLLPTTAGGYTPTDGWTGREPDNAIPDLYQLPPLPSDDDLLSVIDGPWQSIERHTLRVRKALEQILDELGIEKGNPVRTAMLQAVLWHDFGKVHDDWQSEVERVAREAQVALVESEKPFAKFSLAKSPRVLAATGEARRASVYGLKNLFRPGLRHEVASALALRQHHRAAGREPSSFDLLAEFIVMSHHGRVRKVLRNEIPKKPHAGQPGCEEVRGIVEGTTLRPVTVDGHTLSAGPLSIECRQVGRCRDGSEGWTRGILRLLEEFGPLRLAYCEALFRAADQRVSIPTDKDPAP